MKNRIYLKGREDSAHEDKIIFIFSLLISLATVKLGLM